MRQAATIPERSLLNAGTIAALHGANLPVTQSDIVSTLYDGRARTDQIGCYERVGGVARERVTGNQEFGQAWHCTIGQLTQEPSLSPSIQRMNRVAQALCLQPSTSAVK
ncbi:MAG: hypothetical protein HLUCCA12_15920 [Rhodobacteraceae bacterium HLUCCA12]|nr:MAG: hypothetical protein HLUCCA12_15920 [Rhodobacteraceae bacterium HLUCCA12]